MSEALERVTRILQAWRVASPRPHPDDTPNLLLEADPDVYAALMAKLEPLGTVSLAVMTAFAADYLRINRSEAVWFKEVVTALHNRAVGLTRKPFTKTA